MRIFFLLFMLLLIDETGYGQGFSFSGTVKNGDGNALSFVSVSLKNTKYETASDADGTFRLINIPAGDYKLVVSHVGFKTFEKDIKITSRNVVEDVVLISDTKDLDEVLVKTEKQSRVQEMKPITISSVEIKNVVSQNVLITDIIDRLSGVRIRRSSSLGEPSDISINGLRGNAVRVYIDGLPMEFIYPNFDISTLPIGNLKRIDVYKGVLPVDVGTDALGGGINLVTEQKSYNSLRASYNVGSYNTHLGDFALGLANKKNYFLNVTGAVNYSDNSYRMDARIFENGNRIERVKRFHDQYRIFFGGITIGTHSKPWADELKLSVNVSGGNKELQNGARVSGTAFGEAKYKAENLTAVLKYEKSLWKQRALFSTAANYSSQTLNYVDTTTNVYSWSGKVIGRKESPGEYYEANSDTYIHGWINRSSFTFKISPDHKLLFSNLYAKQKLTGIDYLEADPMEDYLRIPQFLTKNVAGVQYEGLFMNRLTFSAATKRYDYILDGAENNTFELVKKKDGIWGWNTALKYDIAEGFFTRASFEKGYLIPQFAQFVGNGADIVRNTDLLPESSDNLNIGVVISKPVTKILSITTNINGFYRSQHDIIFIGNGVIRRYDNADQVRTLGVEGDVALTFKNAFSLKTNLTFLRKTFTKMKLAESQFLVGTDFPNNPNFYGNSELSWQKPGLLKTDDRFRAYLFYNYIAPFNHITVGKGNSIKNTPEAYVPVQHRLDAGFSYKFAKRGLIASLNVINVFNAKLFDNYLVPRAGTNFNVKLIYEISRF
ncbi:TonB-dependent receptor [Dyadobacter chenwenxiniae]|uniref:TonB-dependent receptor n=1 Tax=Dyadobacter chenwenxiniae TaxID=2906456 RepID=A0A9X1PH94_9BACT|nr:TonB-dependent receptor [Dyadobacter chenwenxiniae]MCF0060728.1 TonB-dependent receptor [Dyadobacter chenwenxiniae]UON80562.1 TonB-dependent receptor [Dyadobacter chenwenxiniae]